MNIESYLRVKRESINQALEKYLAAKPEWPPRLQEAMTYSMKAGGKRIRPILVLAACEACGGTPEKAMPIAISLEMIHTFSLIHDDLPAMDNDDLRRGMPTSHVVYGEGMAILAGDGLLAEAFYLLAQAKIPVEIIKDIALAAGPAGMVGGQVLDLEGEGTVMELKELEKIHRYKTGRLIASAVVSGAKLAKANGQSLEALKVYGEKAGLAFQIADDILNVEGTLANMGKSVGSDQTHDKSTYPGILGIKVSKEKANQLVQEAIASLEYFGEKADPLRQIARYIVDRKS